MATATQMIRDKSCHNAETQIIVVANTVLLILLYKWRVAMLSYYWCGRNHRSSTCLCFWCNLQEVQTIIIYWGLLILDIRLHNYIWFSYLCTGVFDCFIKQNLAFYLFAQCTQCQYCLMGFVGWLHGSYTQCLDIEISYYRRHTENTKNLVLDFSPKPNVVSLWIYNTSLRISQMFLWVSI